MSGVKKGTLRLEQRWRRIIIIQELAHLNFTIYISCLNSFIPNFRRYSIMKTKHRYSLLLPSQVMLPRIFPNKTNHPSQCFCLGRKGSRFRAECSEAINSACRNPNRAAPVKWWLRKTSWPGSRSLLPFIEHSYLLT